MGVRPNSPGEWPPDAAIALELPATQPRPIGPCPYRGLAAFRPQDAPFFFGREAFVKQLAAAVCQGSPLTAVTGASGSNRSSAVCAGLLPRLGQEAGWLSAQLRPGDRPFDALSAALLPLLALQLPAADRLIETQKLAGALLASDLTLTQVAQRVLALPPEAGRLLLVLDLFEELFELGAELTMRQRFIDEMLAARSGRFAARLRAAAHPARQLHGPGAGPPPPADALQAGALMLGLVTAETLRAAFEPGLVDRILEYVGQEPGALLASAGDAEIFTDRLAHATGDAAELVGGHVHMLLWDVATDRVRQCFTPPGLRMPLPSPSARTAAPHWPDRSTTMWPSCGTCPVAPGQAPCAAIARGDGGGFQSRRPARPHRLLRRQR